jgi:thiol:disulfide interchange protein DsbC
MKKFLAITLVLISNYALADVSIVVNKLKPFFPEIQAENISPFTIRWLLRGHSY